MENSRNLGRAFAASFLSALVGAGLSAGLLCIFAIIGGLGQSSGGLIVVPFVWIMSFFMGLIFAVPASLLVGAPLTWALGDKATSSKIVIVVFALVGAIVGSGIFILIGDDTSGVAAMAKIACPLYGAVIAGLHPIFAARLTRAGW